VVLQHRQGRALVLAIFPPRAGLGTLLVILPRGECTQVREAQGDLCEGFQKERRS
jgi:hypothetical protein